MISITTPNNKHHQDDFLQKAGIAAGAAVVGAAVGATAVVLNDPDMKKKVGDKIEEIKSDVEDKINEAKEEAAKKLEK